MYYLGRLIRLITGSVPDHIQAWPEIAIELAISACLKWQCRGMFLCPSTWICLSWLCSVMKGRCSACIPDRKSASMLRISALEFHIHWALPHLSGVAATQRDRHVAGMWREGQRYHTTTDLWSLPWRQILWCVGETVTITEFSNGNGSSAAPLSIKLCWSKKKEHPSCLDVPPFRWDQVAGRLPFIRL